LEAAAKTVMPWAPPPRWRGRYHGRIGVRGAPGEDFGDLGYRAGPADPQARFVSVVSRSTANADRVAAPWARPWQAAPFVRRYGHIARRGSARSS